MPEYIERETAIAWFIPYAHAGERIDADVVISDIKGMKAADVATVRHGQWSRFYKSGVEADEGFVSSCCDMWNKRRSHYCPNCGCLMDGGDA